MTAVSSSAAGVDLRALGPEDGAAIDALSRVCPDTGRMQNSVRYRIDAYRALDALRPGTTGIGAEAPGERGLAGALFVTASRRDVEGQPSRCALLHTLMVHPGHRGKRRARRLVADGLARCREPVDGPILSAVQQGNAASFAVFHGSGFTDHALIKGVFVPMRRRPAEMSGVTVRPAAPEDLPAVARALNEMYAGYNLYAPQTAESLARRLSESPFDSPWRHHLVAFDAAGRALAGITVLEQYRLRTIHVDHLPWWLRLANHVIGVVPRSREIRQLSTEMAWFAPGQEAAARGLWHTIRYRFRDQADTLIAFYDPRSPIGRMYESPRWLPPATMTLLTCTPGAMSPHRPLYPFL